jgi:ubiquinone/menaquinone biosynthesis C-methylase UbiE
MEPNEYERMYTVENQHWWYLGMAEITCSILNYYTNPELNQNILDAGCGTGAAMSTFLSNYGNVTGFDISPLAIRLCQKRHLVRLTLASVLEIPFPYNYFDLITSFDVLYERAVIKDSLAVDEFMRVLRPGGFLFLRLPAYDWLRGHHDITIHTARRYTKQQVTQLLINSGFQMVHIRRYHGLICEDRK